MHEAVGYAELGFAYVKEPEFELYLNTIFNKFEWLVDAEFVFFLKF